MPSSPSCPLDGLSSNKHYIRQVIQPNHPILPYDRAAADWRGRERAHQVRSGQPTPIVEPMIAAIAVVNERTLVTNDTSDFSRFSKLALEDWSVS